jgi:catechol 2,3-dioxygenase-like lactoylglutathione lyase family enzyme
MGLIDRIDTLCLIVRNVEKSTMWYEDVLGFTVTFKGEGYRVLSIGEGSVPLTLQEGEGEAKKNLAYPIFFSHDIDRTYKDLKNKEVLLSDIHQDGVNRYFDFYDPDENRLQVCFFE